jgi:outer membrane protein assembly factor BamB
MKSKKNLPLLLLSLLLLSSCGGRNENTHTHNTFGGNTDWKIFRGDPALSGFTGVSLPRNPTLKWAYRSDNRTSSSPIVYNGVTYWSDRRGQILGVDINGEPVFEFDMQTATDASPMIYNSTLYIGRVDGFMTAISLAEKDTIWTFETLGQISGSANMVEFEGRTAIVFGSYDNYLYCLDATTGEELSRFASGNFINGAAAVWENYVMFGGCDAWVRVIDSGTGTAVDSLQLQTYVPNSPAIMGNIGFVGDHSGNIYKLQFENGKINHHQLIEHQDNDAGSNVAVPAVSPDAVYFYSGRHLYAVNRANGALMWSQLLSGNTGESSPVAANDRVIACTRTGVISIFDAKSGELLWEYDTGEQILGSPAVVEGYFMVLTGRGTLLCFGNEN